MGPTRFKLATRPKIPVTVDVACPEDETNVQSGDGTAHLSTPHNSRILLSKSG